MQQWHDPATSGRRGDRSNGRMTRSGNSVHVPAKQVRWKAMVPPAPKDHASDRVDDGGAGSSGHRHRDGRI
jgi:hypothetical protein